MPASFIKRNTLWPWVRLTVFAGLFALAAIFLFGAAVYLPWLRAAKITVAGAEHVGAQDIFEEARASILRQPFGHYLGFGSMLLWGQSSLALVNPLVSRAEVERYWLTREVRITVHERARDFIWCAANSCAWVDKTGIALEEAPASEGQLVDVVFVNSETPPRVGTPVFDHLKLSYLEKILQGIKQAGISVAGIYLDVNFGEVTINTKAGANLFFSLRFDPVPTIAPLQKFGASDLRQISYVDFRIENKVYYSTLRNTK